MYFYTRGIQTVGKEISTSGEEQTDVSLWSPNQSKQ